MSWGSLADRADDGQMHLFYTLLLDYGTAVLASLLPHFGAKST